MTIGRGDIIKLGGFDLWKGRSGDVANSSEVTRFNSDTSSSTENEAGREGVGKGGGGGRG